MSGKLHLKDEAFQPDAFAFTEANLAAAQAIIAKYPAGRQQSAVMPLLALAQKQNQNWLPQAAMDYVAVMLGMAPIRVYEVASFYTMYNLKPVGKHHLQVCTTTPCWLKGSDAIMQTCEKKLGIKHGQTTNDGSFTLTEVECLGACVNAPMMQVTSHDGRDEFFEDLTAENTAALLDALSRGEVPKPGPQSGRISSEPEGLKPSASAKKSTPAKETGAKATVSSETRQDTVEGHAPGNHPEGDKRYSAEPKDKKKEATIQEAKKGVE